jgi:hypothetical protein
VIVNIITYESDYTNYGGNLRWCFLPPETAHGRAAQIHSDEKAKGVLCLSWTKDASGSSESSPGFWSPSTCVADDGSPRTDKMIAAAAQWATLIMKKVDVVVGN